MVLGFSCKCFLRLLESEGSCLKPSPAIHGPIPIALPFSKIQVWGLFHFFKPQTPVWFSDTLPPSLKGDLRDLPGDPMHDIKYIQPLRLSPITHHQSLLPWAYLRVSVSAGCSTKKSQLLFKWLSTNRSKIFFITKQNGRVMLMRIYLVTHNVTKGLLKCSKNRVFFAF